MPSALKNLALIHDDYLIAVANRTQSVDRANVFLRDTVPGQNLVNRIPKALMRKAAELGLADSPEYQALAEFFGAQGNPSDSTFEFTKHVSDKPMSTALDAGEAGNLDRMMNALLEKVEAELR